METWEAWRRPCFRTDRRIWICWTCNARSVRLLRLAAPAAKGAVLRDLLSRATPLEAKYIIKIMTGDLRIGLKESLVEEAIAKAYGNPAADVQRANMLLGDIGET